MIDIVSIHIPKTGGSSFYEILKIVYGEDKVIRYNQARYKNVIDSGKTLEQDLGSEISVVQGHLWYKHVKKLIKKNQSKVIIWMRDPIERVISNYTWWEYRVRTRPDHPEKYRINEPIEVYITRKETQNRMYKAIKGLKLKDVYFIGFLENFDSDMKELANKLDWPFIPNSHEKNSKSFTVKPEISDDLKKKIAKLNRKDIKLFERAKKEKNNKL